MILSIRGYVMICPFTHWLGVISRFSPCWFRSFFQLPNCHVWDGLAARPAIFFAATEGHQKHQLFPSFHHIHRICWLIYRHFISFHHFWS